jgi:hypothetical protein
MAKSKFKVGEEVRLRPDLLRKCLQVEVTDELAGVFQYGICRNMHIYINQCKGIGKVNQTPCSSNAAVLVSLPAGGLNGRTTWSFAPSELVKKNVLCINELGNFPKKSKREVSL